LSDATTGPLVYSSITAAMIPSPQAGSHTLPVDPTPSFGSTCANSARVAHGGVGK
jgi:hypothetical protein